jgi:serine/threonine-protein kinase
MTPSLPCPDPDRLGRLLRGELPDDEAEPLELHLSACEPCGRRAAGLSATDRLAEAVRAGARSEATVLPPPVRQLLTRLHELPAAPHGGDGELYQFLSPDREGDLGRLGPYQVMRVLGRGGMGVVFLAEDPALKRRVALKVLLDARYAEPRYVARFKGEAEAVARLRHPNIVQIHEVGAHQGRPYLALEYVDGGTLAERVAGRPQSPWPAAELVETMARAVQHAHEQGVVHRDLKPANVLLSRCHKRPACEPGS